MNDDIVNRLRNRSESWENNGMLDPDCIDARWDREAADEIERLQKDIQQRSLDHLTTIGELQTAGDEIQRLRALIVEWDDANNFGSLHGDDLTAAVDRLNASEKALIEEARRG